MTGPLATYRELVQAGELEADAAQLNAAEHLELLHLRLEDYERQGTRGFFSFLNSSSRENKPQGTYLHGDVGRGKSMLMDLFFEHAPTAPKQRVHFHSFMLETHKAIAAWRSLGDKERSRQVNFVKDAGDDPIAPVARGIAQSATLLCFDEFQVSDITDAMILSRLFEALFDEGVIVVATSNRAPDALYEGGLNRQLFVPFIDLVKTHMDVVHLNAPVDYRLSRISGAPVYYFPLSEEADACMDAAWRRLTDCDAGAREELEVQGRKFIVPQAAKGAARFSFDDLAGQPLGAADYLALAQHFHTVLIDRIPCMRREQRNEAKRFVTLIDALYNNHVKLICSADGGPDELYEQGDGAFEFARAASRLVEMQSEDYLAHGHAI